jgi:hypothetical protein
MAKKITELTDDGKVVTYKPKRVKQVNFPVTIVDTRAKKIARALWG